jgi:hypothetical protein
LVRETRLLWLAVSFATKGLMLVDRPKATLLGSIAQVELPKCSFMHYFFGFTSAHHTLYFFPNPTHLMPSGVGIESPLFSFPQPTSGAGSLGVYKAFNEDELKEGVERVLNDMAHIAYLSSNPGTQQEAPMVVYVPLKV